MARKFDDKSKYQERIVTGIRQGGSIVLTLTGIIEEGIGYRVQKIYSTIKNKPYILITESHPDDNVLAIIEKE